jgi:hypothetical protein
MAEDWGALHEWFESSPLQKFFRWQEAQTHKEYAAYLEQQESDVRREVTKPRRPSSVRRSQGVPVETARQLLPLLSSALSKARRGEGLDADEEVAVSRALAVRGVPPRWETPSGSAGATGGTPVVPSSESLAEKTRRLWARANDRSGLLVAEALFRVGKERHAVRDPAGSGRFHPRGGVPSSLWTHRGASLLR